MSIFRRMRAAITDRYATTFPKQLLEFRRSGTDEDDGPEAQILWLGEDAQNILQERARVTVQSVAGELFIRVSPSAGRCVDLWLEPERGEITRVTGVGIEDHARTSVHATT